MLTNESTERTNPVKKMKQNTAEKCTSSPVRVKQTTRMKLIELLAKANKLKTARRIKPDDIIAFSLNLLNDEHLDQICNISLTNKDRFEALFKKVSRKKRHFSR